MGRVFRGLFESRNSRPRYELSPHFALNVALHIQREKERPLDRSDLNLIKPTGRFQPT